MNELLRVIGDIHGLFRAYRNIIRNCSKSVQVGDMGVGFIRYGGPFHGTPSQNPPFYAMAKGNHRFERGNHDNPNVCKKHKFWIPDGTVEDNMMFVGGEFSIDRDYRQEGYNWWPDEQLSITEFNQVVDTYWVAKPEIMITHGCPLDVVEMVCAQRRVRFFEPSRTTQAFQIMFEMHKPKLWIFGHHHFSFDKVMSGTRFICLNELEYCDVNTENMEVNKPDVR